MTAHSPEANLISKAGAESAVHEALTAIDRGVGMWDRGPEQRALRTLYEAGERAKAIMSRAELEHAIRKREEHIVKEQNALADQKRKLETLDG